MDPIERLESKVDKFGEKLEVLTTTLVRNTDSLEYHARRSDLAEENITLLRAEVRPLTKAHHMWIGVGKTLVALAGIASVVGVAFEAVKFFGG